MSAGSGRVEVTTAGITFNGADLNNDDSGAAGTSCPTAATTSLDANAVSAVGFDTDGYTTGHGLADGKFVIPTTGYYDIACQVGGAWSAAPSPPANQNVFLGVYDDLSTLLCWGYIYNDNSNPVVVLSRRVNLAAGRVLNMKVTNNSGYTIVCFINWWSLDYRGI